MHKAQVCKITQKNIAQIQNKNCTKVRSVNEYYMLTDLEKHSQTLSILPSVLLNTTVSDKINGGYRAFRTGLAVPVWPFC